jgi:PAS domain S-box-containing protein
MAETDRQRLNSIVSNVPGIVFESSRHPGDERTRAVFISNYAETLLGYSPQEWQKNPDFWYSVIHPDDIERVRRRATEMYESGKADVLQFRCVNRDGEIVHVESRLTILKDEDGNFRGTAGVMMDITQRKVMEEALVQYARDLRGSNKELEQFAYIASHDLQEPLRMITSYLQLVEQRYSDKLDTDAKEFIDFAVDGASRMKRLISDLLTYSRVQRAPMEPGPVDMEVVLKNVLNSLQLSIEDTQATVTHDALPEITAHEGQMEQVLRNLVSNALKFHGDHPPQIHIGARATPTFWEFCVRDNGIGIDEKYLDRIFIIFQRLHSSDTYPGTGIGLAICKKIVEKHGGEIRVESRPGAGTTFTFTISTTVGRGSRNDN